MDLTHFDQDGRARMVDVSTKVETVRTAAAKQTAGLIPMCHLLNLTAVQIDFTFIDHKRIQIEAIVKVSGKTGVEMEALTAVSIAALTIYDMCKAIDKAMIIENICLLEKSGGKSGHYMRDK
jgi:cyclic pyranopterin phosphate synthase